MASVSTARTNDFIIRQLNENSDILFALAVVGVIIMLIIPMPTWFLDFMLAANITFSMVVLLVTIYNTEPLNLSVFPSLLLFFYPFPAGSECFFNQIDPGSGLCR